MCNQFVLGVLGGGGRGEIVPSQTGSRFMYAHLLNFYCFYGVTIVYNWNSLLLW